MIISKLINLKGKTFGNLKVLKRVENSASGQPRWLCKCKCGNKCVVDGRHLKDGKVRSCGCIPRGALPVMEMPEREMTQPSNSLGRLVRSGGDPWLNLASAIVAVAADDYRSAIYNEDNDLIRSLEEFFYSDWYRMLTNMDAERLLNMLRMDQNGYLDVINI